MEKRFIYGLASEWYGVDNANKSANESKYAGSIVFIKNDTDQTKGDAIWAQGAYFEMNNVSDVQGIIESYLKEGKNIDIEVADGGLKISAVSIDSIGGLTEADETKLVEAKAVAGALTNPFKLTLAVTENKGQFTQHFKNLKGEDVTFASAIIEGGNGINLTQTTDGLKIDVDLTDLKAGLDYNSGNVITVNAEDRTINHNEVAATTQTTGTAINPTSDAKSFDIKSYGFDKYGHIATETTTTVTLPDTAFTDANTTYDLDATANATKGVDVNLKGNDTTTDTVTFVGGSNVEVSLKDGKVEISSSFENDNTTYTGENAIVVTQPEEGQTEGKVTLKIDETEKVLTQSASGLKTNLVIDYVTSTNKIRLTNGTDVISEFDASAFVKDSFLKGVEITEENAEGVKGNYLKFTFETVDTDGTGDPEDSTKVIYVDIQEFYVKTTVSGDELTYSSVANTGNDYKVSNVLGTITRDNTSNTITVSKDGLATVADIKNVLETIDSDLDAVKPEGSNENEIAVVTGITQVDGKITIIDSGLAATKAYVDGAISSLDSELTASSEYFTKVVITDGKLDTTNSTKANISEAKLNNFTTTSTDKYVGIESTDTINGAFDKLERAWDWGTIIQ